MYAFSWERDSDRFADAEYLSVDEVETDEFEDVEIDESYEGDEDDF